MWIPHRYIRTQDVIIPTVVHPPPGVSVFLLVHNEEKNIQRVVEGYQTELLKLTDDYEIIVVDDGSSDRSRQIAEGIAATDKYIRLVYHAINQGYGAAVISGMKAARKPYVLLSDGDGQFDSADAAALVAKIRDYDVVVSAAAFLAPTR